MIGGAEDSGADSVDEIIQECAVEAPEDPEDTAAAQGADIVVAEYSEASMADAIAEAIAASFQPSPCLLYTSRCV